MSHARCGRAIGAAAPFPADAPQPLPRGADAAGLVDAIACLYETIAQPARWPRFLDRFNDIVGAEHAISGVIDFSQPDIQFNNGDSAFGPEHLGRFFEIAASHHADGATALMDRPPQSVVLDSEIWLDRAAYRERPLVRHLSETYGVRSLVAANANPNRSWYDYLVLMYADELDELDGPRRDAIAFFLPHIAKANAARRPLELLRRRYQAVFSALDRLAFGVILTDATGAVIAANLAAEALLEESDGIRRRNGRLVGADDAAAATVARTIDIATAAARRRDVRLVGTGLVPRRSGGAPLIVEGAPFRDDAAGELGVAVCGAMLFVIDPDNPALLAADAVTQVYRLTRAESSVCEALLRGASNDEIAEAHSIAVTTVKTHVRSILAKTYASDRNDLLRLSVNLTLPMRGA